MSAVQIIGGVGIAAFVCLIGYGIRVWWLIPAEGSEASE